MGRDDRYTETFTSVPEGHQGPYVIPPLDEMRRRGTRPPTPQPSRPRRRGRGWLVLPILVVIVVAAFETRLFGLWPVVVETVETWISGAPDEPEPVVPTADADADADAEPSAPPAPQPSEFPLVDAARLAAILDAPEAHVGEGFVAYAEILAPDTPEADVPADAAAHLVTLSARQPATAYEYVGDNQTVIVDPEGRPVETGDVLLVSLAVPDPESFDSYYDLAGIDSARFDVVELEVVGLYDLAQDVTLGELRLDGDEPVLPVSVRNSADVPMEYAIDITALNPDGSEAATSIAWSADIAPGETGAADVTLYGAVPDGVTFRIDSVSRYAH
ncbi:hypothetical protein [Microbacterium sp. KNMS]